MANPFLFKEQISTDLLSADHLTWEDQSGNGLELTMANAPTLDYGDADSEYHAHWTLDGVDQYGSVADDADLDMGTGDFALEAIVRSDVIDSAYHLIYSKGQAAEPTTQLYLGNDNKFKFIYSTAGEGSKAAIADAVAVANTWYHLLGVRDADGVTTLYINGVAQATAPASHAGDLTNAIESSIGRGTATLFWDGDIALVRVWNRALSAAEVATLYNGGDFWGQDVPAADQWGSQTEIITAVNDRTFAGASNWVDGNCATYDENVDLSITSNAAGQWARLGETWAPMTIGYIYRLEFDVAGVDAVGWAIRDHGSYQTFGTVTDADNGTRVVFHFTFNPSTATDGGIRFRATGASSTGDFDNFSLVRTGCVAEWRLDHENAYSPFEFSKGRFVPVHEPLRPNQLVGVAGGGQVKVADLGDPEETFPIRVLRVSETVKDNLEAFLADSTVNYAQYDFTFAEEDATEHTVRLLGMDASPVPVDNPLVPGARYNLNLVVRKEIS